MTVTVATIPCNLCGGAEVSVLSQVSRSGDRLRSVACRQCGLVWSDPRPHDARRFYEDDYRLSYKGTFEPRPKHVLRAGKVAVSRLAKVERFLAGSMRVLDVGSGGGEFAYLLKKLGHDVHGIEPNRGYGDYAVRQYGIGVTLGFAGDVPLEETAFDLITIWHVLEHTEDPAEVLRQLRCALRPDGVVVIEVPNVEATCQSPRSTFHEAHLYNFNLASLEAMCSKAGLQPQWRTVSDDGGNITIGCRRAPMAQPAVAAAIPGNHDRVVGVVRRHARVSRWLSAAPYQRTAQRLGRSLRERFETAGGATGRRLLDTVYGHALASRCPRGPGRPRGPMPAWGLVAAAYLFALVVEELLLDRVLPGQGWTERQALALYLAIQCAVVACVVRRMKTRPHLLRLGGWVLPLFALPAYC